MELRTFNSAADVRDYISALVDEGLAYHFDDDPYDVFDDYALAGVIDFNTMQMRDYCEEHGIDSFKILVELTK
jgi:hypothetical protein